MTLNDRLRSLEKAIEAYALLAAKGKDHYPVQVGVLMGLLGTAIIYAGDRDQEVLDRMHEILANMTQKEVQK